jgi:folate-binding protein YgfZ
MESSEKSKVIATPLAELHRSAGARMGIWFGAAQPDDFGDVREEQRFANESIALVDNTHRAYLTFTGPDRVRYLNAILTNDIKNLALGHGNISLLLNPQGRILAEIETHALPDRLLCVSYGMIRARLIEWLEKYIIMDDVTLTDDSDNFGTLALEGPKTKLAIRELTATDFSAMADGTSLAFAIRNRRASAVPGRLLRRSARSAEFIVAQKDLRAAWKILEDTVKNLGGGAMGYAALSAQRLVQGVAWFGYDFGEKHIPHEAGLQDSHISYTKGCYTGQEIVERVRSRGQVNRQRVGLLFAGGAKSEPGAPDADASSGLRGRTVSSTASSDIVPPAGAPLLLDGAEVGYVTRAAQSFYPPEVLAMGYVRKEGAALGTILRCGDETASIVNLPLSTKSDDLT